MPRPATNYARQMPSAKPAGGPGIRAQVREKLLAIALLVVDIENLLNQPAKPQPPTPSSQPARTRQTRQAPRMLKGCPCCSTGNCPCPCHRGPS